MITFIVVSTIPTVIAFTLIAPCAFAQADTDTGFIFQKVYWEMNGDNIFSNMQHPKVKMDVDAAGNMRYSCVNCAGGMGTFKGHIPEAQMAEIVRLVRKCNPATFSIPEGHSHTVADYTIKFYYNNTKKEAHGQMISPDARDLITYMDRLKDRVKTEKVSGMYE